MQSVLLPVFELLREPKFGLKEAWHACFDVRWSRILEADTKTPGEA